jgi:hypothetical protein
MTKDTEIDEVYRQLMQRLAVFLDGMFNGEAKGDDRETGFILLVYPFGKASGRVNYISNGANRRDVVVLFKEMIARFEGQPEVTGHG